MIPYHVSPGAVFVILPPRHIFSTMSLLLSPKFFFPFYLFHLSQSFFFPFFQDFVSIRIRSLSSYYSLFSRGLRFSVRSAHSILDVSTVIPYQSSLFLSLQFIPFHLFFWLSSFFPFKIFSLRCPVCGPVTSFLHRDIIYAFLSFEFFQLSPLAMGVPCHVFLVPGGVRVSTSSSNLPTHQLSCFFLPGLFPVLAPPFGWHSNHFPASHLPPLYYLDNPTSLPISICNQRIP